MRSDHAGNYSEIIRSENRAASSTNPDLADTRDVGDA